MNSVLCLTPDQTEALSDLAACLREQPDGSQLAQALRQLPGYLPAFLDGLSDALKKQARATYQAEVRHGWGAWKVYGMPGDYDTALYWLNAARQGHERIGQQVRDTPMGFVQLAGKVIATEYRVIGIFAASVE